MTSCPYCAESIDEHVRVCPFCDSNLAESPTPAVAPSQNLGDHAGMRMMLPVGRSGWAIAAGYLGLLAIAIVPAPLALAVGVIAAIHLRRNPHLHGWGGSFWGW